MKYLMIALFAIVISGCQEDSVISLESRTVPCTTTPKCEESAVVDSKLYDRVEASGYSIDQVSLYGDCLEVQVSAPGCNGEDWSLYLIDSGRIAESDPVQRYLKLALENPEDCEANITKTVSFDISCLKTQGDSVSLNLVNWEEQIQYSY